MFSDLADFFTGWAWLIREIQFEVSFFWCSDACSFTFSIRVLQRAEYAKLTGNLEKYGFGNVFCFLFWRFVAIFQRFLAFLKKIHFSKITYNQHAVNPIYRPLIPDRLLSLIQPSRQNRFQSHHVIMTQRQTLEPTNSTL